MPHLTVFSGRTEAGALLSLDIHGEAVDPVAPWELSIFFVEGAVVELKPGGGIRSFKRCA